MIVAIRHDANNSSHSHHETAGGQVVESVHAQDSLGPGATLNTDISDGGEADVRFGEGYGASVSITLPSDAIEPRSWALFLSHAQNDGSAKPVRAPSALALRDAHSIVV